jgi:hypothetical protein
MSKAEAVLYKCVTKEFSLGTACCTVSSNTQRSYLHRTTYITINKIQKERTESNAIIIIIIIIMAVVLVVILVNVITKPKQVIMVEKETGR